MDGKSRSQPTDLDVHPVNDLTSSATSTDPIVAKQETPKMSRPRIIKNLVIVSLAFLCLFTAFQCLSNLQSSLNKEEGLGTGGLATIYGALVVSSLFLPPFIIRRIGCKWAIAFSMLCYILYMAANFYAVWATIIPTAVILGLGAGPLWSAKCTYLTQTSLWYSRQTGKSEDNVLNTFFGIFFMLFQTNQIWGNLISSQVFGGADNKTLTEENIKSCGVKFCPVSAHNNTNLRKPAIGKVYTLCGIYIGLGVLGFLLICFCLDPIALDKDENKGNRQVSLQLTLETMKLLIRSDYQKLLLVLTLYSGFEQAFVTGDFTKSFVGCALGIENIGYAMICFGIVDAICSMSFGRLVQYLGHIPFFILGFLVHGGCLVYFLLWEPDQEMTYMFYIFAGLWGLGDAVMQTQTNALYGLLFTKDAEAAFSNFRLWQSLGFIISFATQNFLCTDVKIYFCLGSLATGIIFYGIVEFLYKRNTTKPGSELDRAENNLQL